ncbi:myocardin-related transcription factor A-like isoform X2 [Heptranchias perlo]|uniref:myocardin-related transcription factor A-like isoform X2 n=1 Tax=Heptranchias perlo TaxID=212740 RepID=UPI00355953DB
MLDKTRKIKSILSEILSVTGRNTWKGHCYTGGTRHSYQGLKGVLQLKLQQRRTREELASQGIMPPLKSPAAFHEQRRSLERARTEDYLKRKIRSRPERAELVRMHILEDVPYSALADSSSFDEDSSDALSPEQPGSQESLGSLPSPTEARSVDQHHPLPISPTQYLVSLPTGTELSKLKPVSNQQMTKLANGVPSPAAKPTPTLIKQSQPKMARDKNQRSKKLKEPKSRVKKLKYHQYVPPDQKLEKAMLPLDTAYSKLLQQQQLFLQLQILCQQQQHYNYQTILPAPPKPNSDHQTNSSTTPVRTLTNSTSSSGSGGLARQNSCTPTVKPPASLPSNLDEMKVAELKQELKLRALPVSGTKTDLIERLKNYQEQNRGGGPPSTTASTVSKTGTATSKPTEVMVAFPSGRLSSTPTVVTSVTPGDIVVATVTGSSAVKFSTSSTPPVSPAPSDRSVHSMEEGMTSETFTETLRSSPMRVVSKEEPACINGVIGIATLVPSAIRSSTQETCKDTQAASKDLMLQEKDKQIEELTRMLKQKQQLVEALRMQLDQEKRTQPQQQAAVVPSNQKTIPVTIKQENPLSSCPLSGQSTCSASNKSIPLLNHVKSPRRNTSPVDAPDSTLLPTEAVMVKQEACAGTCEQPAPAMLLSPQQPNQVTAGALRTITQGRAPNLLANGAGTHILLTVTPQSTDVHRGSPPASAAKGQLGIQAVQSPPSQGQSQQPRPDTHSKQQQPPSGLMNQPVKKDQKVGLQLITGTPGAVLSYAFTPPNLQPFFVNNVTESSLKGRVNAVSNGPSSTHRENSRSQQMDDLFDILIESGEISPNAKDVSTSLNAPSPQNASPTLAVSPPLVALKVQPPSPQLLLEPIGDGQPSNQESRLEDFLVSTTGVPLLSVDHDGTEPLSLIDDLHNQMLSSSSILEHPHSPMDTSDMHFTADNTNLTLDLADTNLDNMEWLDLTMGGSSVGLAPLSSVTPSVFSTDFLDSHDLQLHWD